MRRAYLAESLCSLTLADTQPRARAYPHVRSGGALPPTPLIRFATRSPVGEEYDGGQVYDGVDAAPVSAVANGSLPWMHWLSNPPKRGQAVRMEDVKVPLQAYP